MSKLEKDIEDTFVKMMAKLRIRTIKLELSNDTGWPDRLVLIPGGKPIFIEFKKPGKKPKPHQEHRLEYLNNKGYLAVWFDDAEKARKYVWDIIPAYIRKQLTET